MATEHPPTKELTKNPLGPSGRAIATNVERLRDEQNLTFAALSERLEKVVKRPIPPLGLRKIVSNTRRVDSDDLVALAVALGVSPVTLLLPVAESGDSVVSATGVGELSARELLGWLRGDVPLRRFWGSPAPFPLLPEWYVAEREAARAREAELMEDFAAAARQMLEKDRTIGELKRQIEELRARGDD